MPDSKVMSAPIAIPPELLRHCYAHGKETYPEEACGYLSGPESESGALTEAHAIPNILTRLHGEDPERYPRTGKDGYFLDPKVRLPLERRLRTEQRALRVIYHTHPDVGAYFSAEDQKQATWNGEPLFPGVIYLVCGVTRGEPDGAILAWWDDATKGWQEFRIEAATHPH